MKVKSIFLLIISFIFNYSIAGSISLSEIELVNSQINKNTYIDERKGEDFWKTPTELRLEGGDCEDFAIAKYFELAQRGFPIEDMKIVHLMMGKNSIQHMVLEINYKNEIYYLDNRYDQLINVSRIDWLPLYSFNEEGFWIYSSSSKSWKFIKDNFSNEKWQRILLEAE